MQLTSQRIAALILRRYSEQHSQQMHSAPYHIAYALAHGKIDVDEAVGLLCDALDETLRLAVIVTERSKTPVIVRVGKDHKEQGT